MDSDGTGNPPPLAALLGHRRDDRLRQGRTCYGHLAGQLGIQLRDGLLQSGVVSDVNGYTLTPRSCRPTCHCPALSGLDRARRPPCRDRRRHPVPSAHRAGLDRPTRQGSLRTAQFHRRHPTDTPRLPPVTVKSEHLTLQPSSRHESAVALKAARVALNAAGPLRRWCRYQSWKCCTEASTIGDSGPGRYARERMPA